MTATTETDIKSMELRTLFHFVTIYFFRFLGNGKKSGPEVIKRFHAQLKF